MATLWIGREIHVGDPLLDAVAAVRQAYVAKIAAGHGLQVHYEHNCGEWVDMGVIGSPMQIADLVEEMFEAGLGGVFTVDLLPGEDRSPLDEISDKHILDCVELD